MAERRRRVSRYSGVDTCQLSGLEPISLYCRRRKRPNDTGSQEALQRRLYTWIFPLPSSGGIHSVYGSCIIGMISGPICVKSAEASKRICFEKQFASHKNLVARQLNFGAGVEKITMIEILGFCARIRLAGS